MNPHAELAVFRCSICGEASQRICCWCTKDACENHVCTQCRRCSDCCECEVGLETGQPLTSSTP